MRLRLGDVTVHALIDSGSTHNLIAKEVASRSGLPMVSNSYATVTMANGERVPCTGVYRRALFSIAGDQFSANFFASLAGVRSGAGYRMARHTQPNPVGF